MSKRKMIKIVVIAIMMSLILMSKAAADSVHRSSNGTLTVVSCSKQERNLVKCSSFLSEGSTIKKPESSCCSGVTTVVKTHPGCLCEAFKDTDKLGYAPNLTRTLSLPAACNVSVPSFRNCTINFPSAPVSSIAAAPFGVLSAPAPAPFGFYDGDDGYFPYNYTENSYKAMVIGLSIAAIILLAICGYCYFRIRKSSNKQKLKQNLNSIVEKMQGTAITMVMLLAGCWRNCYHRIKKSSNKQKLKQNLDSIIEKMQGLSLAAKPMVFFLQGTAITIVMLLADCCGYNRIKKSSNKEKDKQNLDSIIKQYGFLAPTRYSYSQIKKMTNSFRDKLGEGGFGEVYKGTLIIDGWDSRPVAVKVLKATKADGEDFINEVLNISRTSHVNVVTLLGFCIDKKKRALVYEFMANGSLEKYIFKETMSEPATSHLGWERLYQIALGVARGLEYLHRGCNTRILHFDIKPHNILLDQDFCPKISDFGLAKQCKKKESIISMMETRGTIGYIAPEVISRNFGGVSHKSDVYSYGMMLLEMVGGRKNTCPLVSQMSEIYFPHWVYERMVVGGDLKLQGVTTGEENGIARKMIIVGLWCIQNDPMQRPAMKKVIEMLEGSLESVEIPPKPFFGSPSRSEADSSDTAEEITIIL